MSMTDKNMLPYNMSLASLVNIKLREELKRELKRELYEELKR